MDLSQIGLQDFYIDLNSEVVSSIQVKEGELNSRGLLIHIVDRGQPVDMRSSTVTLYTKNENGKLHEKKATVVDAPKGIYQLVFPANMLIQGEVEAELAVRQNDFLILSRTFRIDVDGRVVSGLVDGFNDPDIIEQLLMVNLKEEERIALYETIKAEHESGELVGPQGPPGPPGPPGAGEGGGLTLEDLPNRGSRSAPMGLGPVSTEHITQVNASLNATAYGVNCQVNASEESIANIEMSQVNASLVSVADGMNCQVNASVDSTANGEMSQVNASLESVADGYISQVNASDASTASGENSQINASYSSIASGSRSQVNASYDSTANEEMSQVNASEASTASGYNSQVNASLESTASRYNSQVNASYDSTTNGEMSQVNASSKVINDVAYSSAWGFGHWNDRPSPSNIKIHLLSQSGDINHSGVLNSGHNFTDFAELFPNLTGEEQGYGLIQTIDGHGVRPANSGDQAVGVTSATAGVVLGETPFSWADRWLKDEWGAFIYHNILDENWEPNEDKGETEEDRPTITVPKENPEYDPNMEQVTRQERPDEWTIVGLVGQVYVRLDENVEPMDYVKPLKDGIGQTSSEPTSIRVMKITQEFDKDKGYKIGFCLLK